MKQQVLVCFLVVVLVSLVNGLAIDLSKSIEDVETLLDNLRSLDTNMKEDKINTKQTSIDTKQTSSCRDAENCGKNPGRPKEMCHVPDIKHHCPSMCGRKCGSEDKLDELISFLRNEVQYDDK